MKNVLNNLFQDHNLNFKDFRKYFQEKKILILRDSLKTVPLHGLMQRRAAILRAIIEQRSSINQRNQQLIGFLSSGGQGQRRLARLRTVEIRVQPFGAHLGHFVHVSTVNTLQTAS